jgi:hypothetical protein
MFFLAAINLFRSSLVLYPVTYAAGRHLRGRTQSAVTYPKSAGADIPGEPHARIVPRFFVPETRRSLTHFNSVDQRRPDARTSLFCRLS